MSSPRVSILIPNFNNGRQSSLSGQLDLIGDLLQSLQDTLESDPTPLEILVIDDGSTDDSLATLQAWAGRIWRGGQPFLTLIQSPHLGQLAPHANRLYRQARGDILVRLDGDIVCLTKHWAARLVELFDHSPPRLGIIGPKQLKPDLTIHACGDWILHPSGYVHAGADLPRHGVARMFEVDHTMGCFYCCRRQVFDDVGGYDPAIYRSETEDFGLMARLKGWRCFATPDIEFIHRHTLRKSRQSYYDDPEGVRKDLARMTAKWGFHRLAPDLDQVRQRYAGTPLLWDSPYLKDRSPIPPAPPSPLRLDQTAWTRYAQDDSLRQRMDYHLATVRELIRQAGVPRRLTVMDSGDGLFTYLLAKMGLSCLGLDAHPAHVELARRCVANQTFPGPGPEFQQYSQPYNLPLPADDADLIVLVHVLERHPNPPRLLEHLKQLLAPGKDLLIFSQTIRPPIPDPSDPASHLWTEHRYRWPELINQVQALEGWNVLFKPRLIHDTADMVLVARKHRP